MFKKVWKNKVKILAGGLGLALLSLPILHFSLTEFYFLPQIESQHKNVTTFFPRVLKDLKILSKSPLFSRPVISNNAENFLSKYVSWEGEGFSPLNSNSHKVLRELVSKYPKWKTDATQLKALYDDPVLMEIDTTWINQLSDYSHWDFSSHETVKNQLKKVPGSSGIARVGIFSTLPIPNYSEFRLWALVYVLQEVRKGRSDEGFKNFRKMAQLSHSAGNLVGNMIAAAMLNDEHTLSENLKIENRDLIPYEKIKTYKRVSWAWLGLVRTTWFHSFPKEFEPYLKPETGVCAAAWENSGGLSMFQDFLEDRIVFEKNFSKNLTYSREFQKHLFSVCNLKNYEGFVERTPAGANPLIGRGYNSFFMVGSESVSAAISLNWSRVPYIRQLIGLNLITLSIPDYFTHYTKNEEH